MGDENAVNQETIGQSAINQNIDPFQGGGLSGSSGVIGAVDTLLSTVEANRANAFVKSSAFQVSPLPLSISCSA